MALSLRSWVANDGWARLVLVLWLVANVALFWRTFMTYYSGPQYNYLHQMLGLGLCVSRASATLLNLNCCLVLLPMCRTVLTCLRGKKQVWGRGVRRVFDQSRSFHTTCGFTICFMSVVHVSAHLINAVSFSVRFSDDFPSLNMAQHRGQDPRIIILTTVPGITGVLLVLILFLMFTASSNYIRLSSYEIFFYTHNLFIIFYIILMLHVVGGALKYQSNVDMHPPGCLQSNHTSLSDGVGDNQKDSSLGATETFCREEARFSPHFPVHPCDVIEVCMMKNGFKARPGQYILLSCSSVSSFESHPFTLTKCPTKKKETFCVHLRVVGDWTELLTHQLLTEFSQSEVLPMVHQTRYPKLLVDGPFGSPSEEVFNYKISVCVAGGIGVTPFACILHALLDGWMQYKLRRLYFVWACKDLQSFYWFADLLCTLHNKLWEENRPDYLNIQLYLSTQTEFQHLCEERYKPLSSRLRIGRPQWELLFDEIGRSNNHKRIGVFCCGPKGMSRALHSLCNSNPHPGVTFEFNTESFI
ncbi:NADPH oxidase 4 isoform X5 [Denticeps clupeoides]|uniref:NADPH oxidase 4 isoform X5 n=1 Tax=Denticeps clupeoides TaxID=299321 RepID=UPI0010A3159B|nr:NADPH oxidase 4 isoform X5 [Denticeps clupeoides]